MAETKIKARLKQLHEMSDADLDTTVTTAHKNIYLFRKDRLSKPQTDVKVIKNSRKEIARVLTIKRQRELAQGVEG